MLRGVTGRPRRRLRLALPLVLALALSSGCAWTLGVVVSDEHIADPLGADLIPAMLGTSVHLSAWARVVRGDGEHLITHVLFPLLFLPAFLVDFPLSLTMDLLFLPITIPAEVSRPAPLEGEEATPGSGRPAPRDR